MRTLGVVHIEQSLPPRQPAAFRLLAGKPLVEWIVRRVSDSLWFDDVLILTDRGLLDWQRLTGFFTATTWIGTTNEHLESSNKTRLNAEDE